MINIHKVNKYMWRVTRPYLLNSDATVDRYYSKKT